MTAIENRLPIQVYSKPSCVQCNATYRALDSKGYRYRVIDVEQDEKALALIKGLGYQQAPVVVVPFDWPTEGPRHWSGFQPDAINAIQP